MGDKTEPHLVAIYDIWPADGLGLSPILPLLNKYLQNRPTVSALSLSILTAIFPGKPGLATLWHGGP